MRKALKICGLVLATLLLLLGGLVLWLRSSSGASFAIARLTPILAAQGITLTAAEISGPLPGHLTAREVVLADARGPFLTIWRLEADVTLSALMRGELRVSQLYLATPELLRLPELPEAPSAEEPGGAPTAPPLDIYLEAFSLTDGRLSGGVLAALGVDLSELSLSAAASGQWAGGQATLEVQAALASDLGRSAELDLRGEFRDGVLSAQLSAGAEGLVGEAGSLLKFANAGLLPAWAAGDIGLDGPGKLGLEAWGSWEPGAPAERNAVTAHIQVNSDWSVLTPGFKGPLVFTAGGGWRPDGALIASVGLTSDELAAPQGMFTALDTGLRVEGRWSPATPADLTAWWELSAMDSPGGPLRLSIQGALQPQGSGHQAQITSLTGRLADLSLDGLLTATLGVERPRLTGFLLAEVNGWEKLAALTGQPLFGDPARLKVELQAPVGAPQSVQAELRLPAFQLGQGEDQTVDLNQVTLNLAADDLYGGQNLNLSGLLGPGRSGPLAWQGGSLAAAAQIGQGTFEVSLDRAQLAGARASAQDGLHLGGRFDLSAATADLDRLEFRLAGSGLTLAEPLRLAWGEGLKLSPLRVDFQPNGQLAAEVDLTPGALKIKADLQNLPYRLLQSFGLTPPEGTLESFTADLAQGPEGLGGDFHLRTQVAVSGLKPRLELSGRVAGGSVPALTVDGTLDGGPGWQSGGRLNARVPLTQSINFPQPDRQAPLSGHLDFTGDLAPLWALLHQPDRSLSGRAQLQAELGGSLDRPQPQGSFYLAGGRYADRVLGLLINEMALEAHATLESGLSAVLSAKDQHGGGLALEAKVADLAQPVLSARGRVSRFNPLHRDDLEVFLSGELAAEGPPDRLALSSNLTVDRGELDLKLVTAAGSVPTLDLGDPAEQNGGRPGGPRFDLNISLPNQFFIRGFGLESEWRGDLNIGGSARRPSLTGSLSPVRGYFEIFSKQFQFSGGDIAFSGGTNPSLNLELTNSGPDIEALLRVGGHARQPKLTFDSRPSRPQEEVLSLVLFGKDVSSISRFEALQLARAVRELTAFGEEGGLNPMGFMRESLGLDVLRLGGAEDDRERRTSDLSGSLGRDAHAGGAAGAAETDGLSVEAGKYLSDNIYVGVEHGAEGAAVRMEVELRPNLSLEGRTSAESSRVGLGWKKDY